uniref:Uncharacterized protein n=1 Tax=Anguilla anguilla TaxID=7936 RepID=A0A0E9U2H4_ANGAN
MPANAFFVKRKLALRLNLSSVHRTFF